MIGSANTPSRDTLEVAKLKAKLRPGVMLSAAKKAAIRARLAALVAREA